MYNQQTVALSNNSGQLLAYRKSAMIKYTPDVAYTTDVFNMCQQSTFTKSAKII